MALSYERRGTGNPFTGGDFMRHFTLAATLAALMLAGCATAPATQADQDRAGEQQVRQKQDNETFHLGRQAERSVTINVTMTGENATLNYEPNAVEVTGDVASGGSQSAQGSTDASQGASATQTPTTTQDIKADATVTPTGQ